jgi:hypothetical protein
MRVCGGAAKLPAVGAGITKELAAAVYFCAVWNLGIAAVLNNPLESSTRVWFVTLGAANELLGVLMIASPELMRLGGRLGKWTARPWKAAIRRDELRANRRSLMAEACRDFYSDVVTDRSATTATNA